MVLCFSTIALAAIISGTSTSNISSHVTYTQLTINKPTVSEGDLMLASIAVKDGSVVNVTVPSGWTQIARTDNDVNITLISYWKVAGASEPSTYTWTIDQQTKAVGGITPYSGVDTSNPIDAVAGNIGFGTQATTSAITTTAANEEIVALFATDVNKSFSTPTGMNEKYSLAHTGGPLTAAYDAQQATAGTAGSKSSTISGNKARNWAAQQIALRLASTFCTGGTITTSGERTIHTFTTSGTFDCSGTDGKTVEVLVVGGGGGGATYGGGGGGAGGYLYDVAHTVSAAAYSVTVGAAGAKGTHIGSILTDGGNGGDSIFDTITAVGGGGGGSGGLGNPGLNGGSGGGGGGYDAGVSASGGSGTGGQGNSGGTASGTGPEYGGGGGGGSGGVGGNGSGSSDGAGGNGTASSISGSSVTYAVGGVGKGATGGTGSNATANTGNGGDATAFDGGGGSAGGDGGSGVVIISY